LRVKNFMRCLMIRRSKACNSLVPVDAAGVGVPIIPSRDEGG
jgi:hypothetical protein